MSSSAYGCVFAGLRLDVRTQEVERTKVRYHRDTGNPYDFKHRAVEVSIFLRDIQGSPVFSVVLPDSIDVYECGLWDDWKNNDIRGRITHWLEGLGIAEAVDGKFGYCYSYGDWIIGVMLIECNFSGYDNNDSIDSLEGDEIPAAFKYAQRSICNVFKEWCAPVDLVLSVALC